MPKRESQRLAQDAQRFEHKWYLSNKFSASLEHMQGVYVPYHLYDMTLHGYDWRNYAGDADNHSNCRAV